MTHYSAEELLKVEWWLGGARSSTVDKGRGGGGYSKRGGNNDFDFFWQNGASHTLRKYSFGFFDPFCLYLALMLAKCSNKGNFFLLIIFNMDIEIAEFHADFKSVWKVL